MRKRDIARKARKMVRLSIKVGYLWAKAESAVIAIPSHEFFMDDEDIKDAHTKLLDLEEAQNQMDEEIHWLINKLCDENGVNIRNRNG